MIECYENNYSQEYYINNVVNNLDLKSDEELEIIATNNLNILYDKYIACKTKYSNDNVYIISIHEYIKQNYKYKLLFYSMNHPTKYVIQFICEKIIDILKIKNTINYNIDVLNDNKCVLYKCISKHVYFNIDDYNISISNNSLNINQLTKLYYDTYKRIGVYFE